VKVALLPIKAYDNWDYARDLGKARNWWMATNLEGEPSPGAAGTAERFVVTGVPAAADGGRLYVAVRSFDAAWNRSAMSNLAVPEPE